MTRTPRRPFLFWLPSFVALLAGATVSASAALTVTMNAPGTADLNQPIDYSISVNNTTGGATTLTDILPAGMSFVGATGLATGACATSTAGAQTVVTCNLGTLAAGTPQDFILSARVDAIVGGVNPVSNTAGASSGPDSATSNPTFVQINTQSTLNLQIVGPSAQVAVGDSIVYQLLVINTSNWVPASNVIVYDTLPAGVFNVQFPSNCSSWTAPGGAAGVQCSLGSIASNVNAAVALTMNAPTSPASITDAARVQSDNAPTVQTTFPTTVAALTDLGITETGPTTLQQGAPITYTLAVVNYSQYVSANNVTVTVDVPFTPTSASAGCSLLPTQVVCSIGTLGTSQTTNLTISGTPSGTGVVRSTATVTTSTPESNHHLLQSFWSTVVGSGPVAILQIVKYGPATASIGQGFRFIIAVTNVGVATAIQPIVTDQLPATFAFGIGYNDCGTYSDTPSLNGLHCSYNANGLPPGSGHDVLTWQLPDIAPGQSVGLIVGGIPQVLSSNPLINTGVVTSASDPTSPHSASGQTLIVPPPPLSFSKGAPTYAILGANFSYSMGITNTTGSTLNNIVFTDTLPAGVSYVSLNAVPWLPAWNCNVSHDSGTNRDTVSCIAPPIPPNDGTGNTNFANLGITVRANQLGTVSNTATATSPSFGSLTSPMVQTNIIGGADYDVKALGAPNIALINSDVAFPVTITNHGPDTSGYASVQLYTPNGWVVTGLTSDFANGYHSCTIGAPSTCDWGTQAPGQTVTVTLHARAPAVADPSGSPSAFSATVSAWQTDPNLTNNTANWTTQVLAGANVSINQTSLIRAAVGLPASYTILVTNQGPDDAQNTFVTDTLFAAGGPGAFDTVSASFPGGSCTTVSDPTSSSTTLRCPIGTFHAAAGQNAISINVTFTPRRVGTIVSSASVITDTLNASNAAYNTADISAELSTNLSVNIAAASQVALNGTLQYTILVSNTGINPAANAQVSLALDPNLPNPLSIPGSCSFNAAAHLVSCPLGTLAPNAVPTALIVTASPNAVGQYVSTASVTTDTLNQSLQTSQSATTSVVPGADLSIQMSAPVTQYLGLPVVYQLLVSNTQNSTVSPNTVIVDTIPANATFISASSDLGPCSTTAVGGLTVVRCATGTLAPNASLHATISVQPALSSLNSAIFNSASVSGDSPDPTLANNQTQRTTSIVADPPPSISSVIATPNPVLTSTFTILNVVAQDGDYPESALNYRWTITGPASVSLSDPNTDNAAKHESASFTKAGTYHFIVTVANPSGSSSQSFVDVIVQQGFGSGVGHILVSPKPGSTPPNKDLAFTAIASDQFGDPLLAQPAFVWTATAGGTINANTGVFHAGDVPGTYPNAVTASASGNSDSATVNVLTDFPTIALAASATPNPVTVGTTTVLSVLAADASYLESQLTYQWSVSGGPVGAPVTFSNTANSNAAKNNTASFTAAGTYHFVVTVTNPAGGTITTSVDVVVQQGFGSGVGSVTVSPNPGTLPPNKDLTFTAFAKDQFGNLLLAQPTFTWSASGGGTINANTGVFHSGNIPGSYANAVTAVASANSGSASVNITTDFPTLSVAASASPNPVTTGTTTDLSVLGADSSYPESQLLYQWTVSGGPVGAVVNFTNSSNSNSAKATTAIFTAAGTYHFTVTVTNPASGTVTSSVDVIVQQAFGPGIGSVTISPNPGSVAPNQNVTFSATALDQFGHPMAAQPTFAWSATAGGTIAAGTGVFHSGNTPGTFTNAVHASASGNTGAATVNVTTDFPTLTDVASATPNPVTTGKTTALSVLAADASYSEAQLTYQWSVSGGPVGAVVTFADPTSSNGAKSNIATFTAAGTYHFVVTVTNPAGGTVTSAVDVVVQQGFGSGVGSIVIAPNPGSTPPNKDLAFAATAKDQFGNPLAIQPTFVWTASAGGTINTTGLFHAGDVPGTYSNAVTAAASGNTASVSVTITPDFPTISVAASATPNPVTIGTTTVLSVLATDTSYLESQLKYQWTVTGGAPVSLSNSSNSNAAKMSSATFVAAGTYHFTVAVVNPAGGTVTDHLDVIVQQGFGPGVGSIRITPNPGAIGPNLDLPFVASALDQFGNALASQPSFTWSASAGGTINSATGLFHAGNVVGAYPNAISATASGNSGTASVNVLSDFPTISVAASATPNPVTTSTTTALSVLASDLSYAESQLTYQWSVSGGPGGAPVSFANPTDSNASKTNTAAFQAAGTYHFTVTVTNPAGGTVVSSVDVVVQQGFGAGVGSITILPNPGSTPPNKDLTFTATANDQFGHPLLSQPTFTWSASAGGIIDTLSGVFHSGDVPGSYPSAITASANGDTGSASVTVAPDFPIIVAAAAGTPNPVIIGTTTVLSVLAADSSYAESQLLYHWAVSGGPVGSSVTLSAPSNSNASKSAVASFNSAGSYHFDVTVTNPAGGTVSSSTDVVVLQGFGASGGHIEVLPSTSTLLPGTTQAFSATAYDQFGHVLVIQPTFVWSTPLGAGTVDSTGLYTAGPLKGVYPVQASANGVTGSATVTIPVSLVDHIVVQPDGKTIMVTDQLQFAAVAYDLQNDVIPNVPFTWTISSPDGQISAVGVFKTTSVAAGSRVYTITATAGQKQGFARVTVITPAPAVNSDICGGYGYPVPYKETSGLPGITFTGLAPATHIRIYTVDGRLVQTLQSDGGEDVLWNIRNSSGDKVASGVYIYLLDHNGGACSKTSEKLVIIK